MFDGIANSLRSALTVMSRGGKLTESNIRDGLVEVRKALLEADVHYDVATNFIKRCTEQAIGEKVLKSLRPDQQIIGIIHQELCNLMGPTEHSLHLRRDGLNKIMVCGLQGSGKTTTCGKLARMLKEQGHRPMLVAADLQRPAAIEQLKIIGQQIDVPVHSESPSGTTPLKVCLNGLAAARQAGSDVIIFDTAGRLHVDSGLMNELEQIDRKVQPDQILLVCDAMTGQDAVNSAKAFNEALELDGIILTKLDGDTRGGAALSIKEVTGVPIKFVGMGESLDRLEPFHPNRMAGRILGMGDMVSLFEKAQQEFDTDEVERQKERMLSGRFSLEDFRSQMKMVRRMGSLGDLMKLIPGMGGFANHNPNVDADKDMGRVEAIISSMTAYEREHADRIDRSRRHRIARGAGVDPADVNRLIKDFQNAAGMMQKMAGLGAQDKLKSMKGMIDGGMLNPASSMSMGKERSRRGPADPQVAEEKRKKARKDSKKQKKRNR